MPGEALREADVLRERVEIRDRRVAKHMRGHAPLDSGPLLPGGEAVADLPQRQAPPEAAGEERGIVVEALSLAGLPLVEPAQLAAQRLAEQDFLRAAGFACALEDREQQTPSRPTIPKHIPDRERDELVLAQARAEGHRVQHMIAIASSVLAGDLEQGSRNRSPEHGLTTVAARTGRPSSSAVGRPARS